jgi:hypothetical protein
MLSVHLFVRVSSPLLCFLRDPRRIKEKQASKTYFHYFEEIKGSL